MYEEDMYAPPKNTHKVLVNVVVVIVIVTLAALMAGLIALYLLNDYLGLLDKTYPHFQAVSAYE